MYHFFSEHEHIHDTYIDIVGSDVNHLKNRRFLVNQQWR